MKNLGKDMYKFTIFILKKIIKNYENTKEPEVRVKYGFLEAWISIIGNVIIFGFKIIFGFILNSISLIADSFHTLSDVITSVVVLFGFRASHQPADTKHPYGHGRGESIATLIIGILLIIVGVDFLKLSFNRFIHPQVVKGSWLIAGLLILLALAKEMMAVFSIDLGKEINSSTLIADAWHHRSDAIASFLVAIAIGASIFGYHKVDALFGIIVSLIIIYVGIDLSKSSASFLLGEVPSKDLIEKIEHYAKNVNGVNNVHGIQVHDYGNHFEISLHIEVNKNHPLLTGHEIADFVEKKLFKELKVSSVVHVDPSK